MIFSKVAQLISYQIGLEQNRIIPSSDIFEDLGADSLDIVPLLMSIEDEFGLTIDDDNAQKFRTVGDVVAFIEMNT